MPTKYRVFVIYACDKLDTAGHFINSVELQIIDESIEGAMKSAKELIPKKNVYYLRTIIEKFHEK